MEQTIILLSKIFLQERDFPFVSEGMEVILTMVEEEEEEEGGEKVKSASHASHHLPARASVRQHEIRPEIRSYEGGQSVKEDTI